MDQVKHSDKFESKITSREMPAKLNDAARHVNDTLDISWESAQSIFGDKALPEHALAIYDRIIDQQDYAEAEGL